MGSKILELFFLVLEVIGIGPLIWTTAAPNLVNA